MRDVGCQVDLTTNSYCYIEAVANLDPSSYWFYQLPLGQPLGPKLTSSACNECTAKLMAAYGSALNGTDGTNLAGLARTYNNATDMLNRVCGSTYAKNAQVATSSSWVNAVVPRTNWLLLGVLFAGMLCGS